MIIPMGGLTKPGIPTYKKLGTQFRIGSIQIRSVHIGLTGSHWYHRFDSEQIRSIRIPTSRKVQVERYNGRITVGLRNKTEQQSRLKSDSRVTETRTFKRKVFGER